MAYAFKTFGCPSVFINNIRYRNTENLDAIENWNKSLQLNLTTPFVISKKMIDISDGPGSICHISSIASNLITNEDYSYHVAKAGLNALTKYMALYGAKKNIRSNAILPGLIVQQEHLNKYHHDNNKSFKELAEHYLPSNNPGTENDVANLILFLCSKKASFINGETIVIDGGASVQDQLSLLLNKKEW